MLALAGPGSKGAARENTANELASGRPLTIADLEGVKFHVKLLTEMVLQRESEPQGPVTTEVDWNITVRGEDRLEFPADRSHPTRFPSNRKLPAPPWFTQNGGGGGATRMSITFRQDGSI
jgi:hypothetical protein